MRFREHRGGLASSLETVVTLRNKQALIDHVRKILDAYPGAPPVTPQTLHCRHLVFDPRSGWDTYLITLDDYGVLGFTDRPIDPPLKIRK